MGLQKGLELALLSAQKRVLETQADKNAADAASKSGVETENVKADTKALQRKQKALTFYLESLKKQQEELNLAKDEILDKEWREVLNNLPDKDIVIINESPEPVKDSVGGLKILKRE